MTIERTRARDFDLGRILTGIHEGHVVLPDFQRDYDWGQQDVRALLATVLQGWPIGSLLLMHGPPSFFRVRSFEEAPNLAEPEYVVLDGQQRLTALYQALFDRGDLAYAIKLAALREASPDVDEIEEAIVSLKRADWARYANPREQLRAGYVPLAALQSPAHFYEWRDSATSRQEDEQQRHQLTVLYRDFLGGLHDYDVPAIIVDSGIEPAAIARIFERVNRNGMRLGTFDLMVAKTYSTDFNLRTEWEKAQERYPRLGYFLGGDGFGEDGLPILAAMALRYKLDVRQRAVLALDGPVVRDGWWQAAQCMDTAIAYAVEHLGVWKPDWLPYRNVVSLLAALSFEDRPLADYPELPVWYWSTVFGRRYDVASNTRVVSDYKSWLGADWESTVVAVIRDEAVGASKKTQGAFHRAVLSALAAQSPRDPVNGQLLTPAGVENGKPPTVAPVSVWARREFDAPGVPIHLRTLGFVLASIDNAHVVGRYGLDELDPEGRSSQLMTDDSREDGDPDGFFSSRLERLADWLRGSLSLDVRIVDAEEV